MDPKPEPTLAHVADLYGVTTDGLLVDKDDEQFPVLSVVVVEVCPCTMWQVESHDDDFYPGRNDDTEAALEEHRAECPVLDTLAGLRGIPA